MGKRQGQLPKKRSDRRFARSPRPTKTASRRLLSVDLGADACFREDFEQDHMREAAIKDMRR